MRRLTDMRILRHIIVPVVGIFLLLGVPFICSDWFRENVLGSEPDAASSASLAVDKPSGNYVVVINTDKHTDSSNLALWHDFFQEKDVTFIFEDIVCTVADGDEGGQKLAENYRSRLPENQMLLKSEDPVLMLSKAENGRFDVIVMSEEYAGLFGASSLYGMKNADTIFVKGAAE